MFSTIPTIHYDNSKLLVHVIDNLFHIWSLSRLCPQTAFHDLLKPARLHTGYLRLALLGIWQFPDTHLTEKNSKTVNIHLMTTHFINYGSTTT